ncbi:hypothetical protein Taro_025779 [Colocasia esculenta]|uniref:Uncharacterized protein n=1 Tax=Colocasia esculenta TaxID=4460 RepID=A0A843VD68_COLES|nr:hypothetical protein [Colocasia esculenta]
MFHQMYPNAFVSMPGQPAQQSSTQQQQDMEEIDLVPGTQYDVLKHLDQTPAKISILELIKRSQTHQDALRAFLQRVMVSEDMNPDNLPSVLSIVNRGSTITFSDGELAASEARKMPLCVTLTINKPTPTTIAAYDNSRLACHGIVTLQAELGPLVMSNEFYVLNIDHTYKAILGCSWIESLEPPTSFLPPSTQPIFLPSPKTSAPRHISLPTQCPQLPTFPPPTSNVETMSRSGSRRVVFSPDVNETPTVLLRSCTADRLATTGYQTRVVAAPSAAASTGSSFTHSLCRGAGHLPMRLFRYVGANVVRALCFISGCRSRSPSSSKVSPRTFSKRFAPPQEPHHTEAIEDCIKFINSSSRRSCWNAQPLTADEHLAHAKALPTSP